VPAVHDSVAVLTTHAREAADRAASRAGVAVRELVGPAAAESAAAVFREVWRGGESPAPANLLQTIQSIGGYLHGAYDESGRLVAASMGMLARGPALHSHVTGVLATGRRRGLGLALKLHQRAWALDHGLPRITWTCDPLVRRNVVFNLQALGADVAAYHPDYYGSMTDGLNAGEESDRFTFSWDLAGPRATAAARRRLPDVEPSAPLVVEDAAGHPLGHEVPSGPRRVALPEDVETLRTTDPETARAWRRAVRDAVLPALAEGLQVVGTDPSGALVLDADGRRSREGS
jgi:predicted GNAT superfamily acetyltransferase